MNKKSNLLKTVICTAIFTLTFSASVFAQDVASTTSIKVGKPITSKIRLGGANRYETAIEISKEFAKGDVITNCIIGRDDDFADSISIAPLSVYLNAPLLLTQKEELNTETQARLKEMNIKNVYIIGGTGVISTNVEDQLKALGYNVTRIGGANRIETNRLIMAQIPIDMYGYNPKIINGEDWVQGMSIALDTKCYNDKEKDKVYINPIFIISSSADKPEDFKDIADILTPLRNAWESKAPNYYEVEVDSNVIDNTKTFVSEDGTMYSPAMAAIENLLYKCNYIASGYKRTITDANLTINTEHGPELHRLGISYQVHGALLTRGDDFIDALAVTPLAAKHYEPVVMATIAGKVTSGKTIISANPNLFYGHDDKDRLFLHTYDQIDTVYYIGGAGVVPDGAESFLNGD